MFFLGGGGYGKTGHMNKDKSGMTVRQEKTQGDVEADGGKLKFLPMENTTEKGQMDAGNRTRKDKPAANKQNKRIENHTRKGKASNSGCSKNYHVGEPQQQIRSDFSTKKKMQPLSQKQKMLQQRFLQECPYTDLTVRFRSWEEKVVAILNVVRRREITERNPRTHWEGPTRFCGYNIAFFDFERESRIVHGPLLHDIPPSRHHYLDDSVNVITIKVAVSDVRFPIDVYGTVLARDGYDHRCIYVFRRGRDAPQHITKKNCMLALTGPNRALGGIYNMCFEFHLKIKGDGEVDEDFSKGLMPCGSYRPSTSIPSTYSLHSYLSRMDLMCMLVPYALEASIGVNFLNGGSTFTGKILASTSASDSIKMVLYDSQVDGAKKEFGSGGSVSLRRHVVSVERGQDLLLHFYMHDSYNKSRRLKFVIANGVEERICDLGTYKLQVKIIWKGVFSQQGARLRSIGDDLVLWS